MAKKEKKPENLAERPRLPSKPGYSGLPTEKMVHDPDREHIETGSIYTSPALFEN